MFAALCAVGTLVMDSCGLLCHVAGIGMWASDPGCATMVTQRSLKAPVHLIRVAFISSGYFDKREWFECGRGQSDV